ncbi:MAG TPA: hypothetical protein VNN17_13000 [Terriglobia bacterium]|nr:hypothetical protein [Terriglobia bacterium]
MRMDVKGSEEHVGDIVHRKLTINATGSPQISETVTKTPLEVNPEGRNAFQVRLQYRRKGWGAGAGGWRYKTDRVTAGRLVSTPPLATATTFTQEVNSVALWGEAPLPAPNDLEASTFSPVDFRVAAGWGAWAVNFFGLRTLTDTAEARVDVIFGGTFAHLRSSQNQATSERYFEFNAFGPALHANSFLSQNSAAVAEFGGAGPMAGVETELRWRRLRLQLQATESFLVGNADRQGVFTEADNFTLAQGPSGPFLPCPPLLIDAGCASLQGRNEFSASGRTFVSVTDLQLRTLVEVGGPLSAGVNVFASLWGNAPLSPAFTFPHIFGWRASDRTLRFFGLGFVVAAHF